MTRAVRSGIVCALLLAASPASAQQLCAAAWESYAAPEFGTASLTCPAGVIVSIDFASYGTPTPAPTAPDPSIPACQEPSSIAASACDAPSSLAVVEGLCLGQASCAVEASNDVFGDPCNGTYKWLYILATCANPDSDGDGVPDDVDSCPGTPPGEIVDASGCSIAQHCPCAAPWKNHGEYTSCVAHVATSFRKAGLLSGAEYGATVAEAAHSDCGKSCCNGGTCSCGGD